MILDPKPDWDATYSSKKEFENALRVKFKGYGWYFNGVDTILAFQYEYNDPAAISICVWNRKDAKTLYIQALSLPTFVAEGV